MDKVTPTFSWRAQAPPPNQADSPMREAYLVYKPDMPQASHNCPSKQKMLVVSEEKGKRADKQPYSPTECAEKSRIELRKKLRNKGKPPKVVLIAVAHKPLRKVWE